MGSSDLLGARYRLESVLASGGMGRVWRARDTLLERWVAVKMLRSEFTGDPAFVSRFRAEAQHAALLTDPHIAAVHDYGETVSPDGELLAYLVMELVPGEPLSHLLAREGRLALPLALRILRQTASALAAAHEAGVVHRDVKPANVLVSPEGDVKITDFGIAWSASSVPLTRTGQVIGTAHYLSPEQAQGAKATPASDVYALGVVAYECLAGRLPFDGESSVQVALQQIRELPSPLPSDVPGDVRRLVERAMAKDPAARFPDGAAFRDAIDALPDARLATAAPRQHTAVLPGPALPTSSGPATRVAGPTGAPGVPARATAVLRAEGRRGSRRRWAVIAAAAVLTLMVLVAVTAALGSGGDAATPAAVDVTPSTTAPATPTTHDLAAAELVGRSLTDVRGRLTALGLQVQPHPITTADVPDGQVIAVDPNGQVTPGQTVTVTYAVAPPARPTGTADDTRKGNDRNDHGDRKRDRDGGDD